MALEKEIALKLLLDITEGDVTLEELQVLLAQAREQLDLVGDKGSEEFKQLSAVIDHTNSELEKAGINLRTLNGEVKTVSNGMEAATGNAKMYADANEELSQNLDKVRDTSGLAGATVTSFAQTLSDLPYGLRGVANNLQQMVGLMTTLVAQSGGARAALTALKSAIMGPLGLVVAFNAVISAIQIFSNNQREAKKATDETTKSIAKQTDALDTAAQVYLSIESSAAARRESFRRLQESLPELLGLEFGSAEARERIAEALSRQNQLEELIASRDLLRKELEATENNLGNYERIKDLKERILFTDQQILAIEGRQRVERERARAALEGQKEEIEKIQELELPTIEPTDDFEAEEVILNERIENIGKGYNTIEDIISHNTARILEIEDMARELRRQGEEEYAAWLVQKEQETAQFRLNTAQGMFGALSQLAAAFANDQNKRGKQAFEASKLFAIAETLISTYTSAQKAYQSQFTPVPTPDSPVRGALAASIAVIQGLARVAAIKNTKYGQTQGQQAQTNGFSTFGGFGDVQPQAPQGINIQRPEATRVYVVESDIRNAGNKVDVILRDSTVVK